MPLTLHVPPGLAELLRQAAERSEVDVHTYALRALDAHAHASPQAAVDGPRLPEQERRLLAQIPLGVSAAVWERYHDLRDKFHDRTLTPGEHEELVAISDNLESANVRRLHPLIALAKLRGVPLEALMKSLGIYPGSEDPIGRDVPGAD